LIIDIAVQREEAGKIAFAKGISQGLSQGLSQGSHQAKLETAKNLLQFGLSREKIAQATGLTQAEVEAIHNSQLVIHNS